MLEMSIQLMKYIYEMNSDDYSESTLQNDNDIKRTSKDNTVSSFGRDLISICEEFSLSVLNGLQSLNYPGDYTYVSQTGCSLVDYFIISTNMLSKCMRLSVLPMIESKHLAAELSIATTHTDAAVKGTVNNGFSFVKYTCDEEKSAIFSCMMQTEHTQALMNE